jgi:hypothetical protein
MWQAISRLLSEQLGVGEIEQRDELPGGEIHAAWHLRYGGQDLFVKCDERELLPIFTAEADQLELLSRSNTVRVPKVLAVGSDRDYSFLVMEYLPARPLDAHSAFLLGQQLARLHEWSDQPQFGLDFDNDLSTTPQPNAWQRRWSTFLPSNVSAGNWSWRQKKGWSLAISMPLSNMFSSALLRTNLRHLCFMAICGQQTVRLVRTVRLFTTRHVTGETESVTWQCSRYTRTNRRKFMMATSP